MPTVRVSGHAMDCEREALTHSPIHFVFVIVVVCWNHHKECANLSMDAQRSWAIHTDSEGVETRTELSDVGSGNSNRTIR